MKLNLTCNYKEMGNFIISSCKRQYNSVWELRLLSTYQIPNYLNITFPSFSNKDVV